MREVTLDVTPFEEKISLHRYFKETLGFPFYYGANLDALYDELTSDMEGLKIELVYPKQPKGAMAEYLPRLLHVFEDAVRENYHLEIRYVCKDIA